jgi:hypothetical protein
MKDDRTDVDNESTYIGLVFKAVSQPTNRQIETVERERESVAALCRWFRFAQLAKGKKFRP